MARPVRGACRARRPCARARRSGGRGPGGRCRTRRQCRKPGMMGAVGEEVSARVFTGQDRQRYRHKVRACLDVFANMLAEARFDAERGSFGLEIELNLTDEAGDPAMVNAAALEAIADPDFQTELGQFNVEINLAPRLLGGDVMSTLEESVRASLNVAEDRARTVCAHMMLS